MFRLFLGGPEVLPDLATLADGVRAGNRRRLGQALTLVESKLPAHRAQTSELLSLLSPSPAHRIGVTGPPGAGKSCLIEALGLNLVEAGHRVGVLAVDPSSERSGGSILGDKTRMEELSRHPQAFVRPSPSGGSLGGVARRTREALWILEAAGYDRILVETVGVGQSETAVAQLVDTVLVVLHPGAGDELQGIKRGLMESADVLFVNKADLPGAKEAAQQLSAAVRLLSGSEGWTPPVHSGSALERVGIEELREALESHRTFMEGARLQRRRGRQGLYWLSRLVEEELTRRFYASPEVAGRLPELRQAVEEGTLSPDAAAARLLG